MIVNMLYRPRTGRRLLAAVCDQGYFLAKNFTEHPSFEGTYRYRLVCGVSIRTAALR